MYYPMTSSISNGLVALYGSDERIINNNNNMPICPVTSKIIYGDLNNNMLALSLVVVISLN